MPNDRTFSRGNVNAFLREDGFRVVAQVGALPGVALGAVLGQYAFAGVAVFAVHAAAPLPVVASRYDSSEQLADVLFPAAALAFGVVVFVSRLSFPVPADIACPMRDLRCWALLRRAVAIGWRACK